MRSRAGPVGACGSSRASAASCTASDLQLVEQELRDLLSGYHRLVDEPPHNGPSGSGNPFGLGSPGNPDEPSGSGTPSGLGNPGGSGIPGTPGNPFGLGSPGNTGGLGSPDEPSGFGNPGNPFGLGTPGNTGGLGSPDEPSGSGTPGGLGTPSGSGIPGTPGGLGSPSGPSGLGSPGNPFGPGNPGSLGTPGGLGSPGAPGTPGTPGNPFGLGNPGNTGGSGTPSGLGKPGGPFGLGTPSGSGIPGTPGGLGSPSGPSGLGSPGNPFGLGNPGSLGSPGGSGERRGHSVASLPVSSVRGDHSTDAATPRPFGHGCGAATKPAAIACAMPAAREASPVDLFADVLNEDQLSRFLGMQWKQPQQLLFRSRPCGVLSLNAQSGACEFPNIAYPPERQGAGSPIPHFAMSAPCHMYQELAQQAFSEQPQLKPHRADDEEDYEEYEDDCDSQRQYRHHPYDAYDGQTFTAHRCEHAPVRASDVRGGRRCRRVQKGDSTTPEIATSARRTENPSMRSGAVGCRPKVSGGPDKPSAPPNTNLPLHANARAGVTAPSRPAWIGRDAVRFHVMVERGLAAIAAGERGAAADLPAFADSLVGAAVSAVSPAVRRRQARLRESLHAREAETAQRGAHRGGGGGGGTVTTTASTTPTASITNVWSSRESYRLARSAAEGKEVSRRPKQMHHRAQRERHARQEAQPH